MYRPFWVLILAGVIYFSNFTVSRAFDIISDYSSPEQSHLQAVNEELDRIENSGNNQTSVSQPAIYNQNPAASYTSRNQLTPSQSRIVPKRNVIEFNSETYWAQYDEPKNFYQRGFMSGYNAQIYHRTSTDPKAVINMIGLQGQWASGKFQSKPSDGGFTGIKDHTFDIRGVVGKDFYPAANTRATPYLGYGYRYLKDNSEGLSNVIDGFTLVGYQRFSHYNYLPFGVDWAYQDSPNYGIEGNLEYDYMFYGYQVSKLGVIPGYGTLVVDQKSGSGLRASLRLNMYFKYCTGFVEGFYRYWNIAQSQSKPDPTDPTFSLNEPRNNTQEFGFRLGVQI